MARIRTIKPEFWSSEQVMECSTNARLLFIGIWNFCDDYGRHPVSPRQLKALIFPGDPIIAEDVRRMIDELSSNGLIDIYTVDDKEYFEVTGWSHQKIDRRQDAKFPPKPAEHSSNDRRTIATEGRGEEGNTEGKDSTSPTVPLSTDVDADPEINVPKPKRQKADDAEILLEACQRWNKLAASLGISQIDHVHGSRQSKLRQRLKDLREVYGFEDPLSGFDDVLARIRGSPFLRGETASRGRDPFRIDFDWVTKLANFTKIMEGNYAASQRPNGFGRH